MKTYPNQALVKDILEDSDIKRLAGFAGQAFETYNKPVFDEYNNVLKVTCKTLDLKPNFSNSPWTACTANLGKDVVTIPHLDPANLAFGWCSVTALGNFDPDAGGHLVLWDLGIYIRFPPGSTILIPSALVVHSNLPIRQGDTRCSLTQYTAGSLFRWVYNKGRNDKEFEVSATMEEKEMRVEDQLNRWEKGLNYFPMVVNNAC